MPNRKRRSLGQAEQVALLAILISLIALSIDAMLPALPTIGRELGLIDPNRAQLIISGLLIGLSLGQLIYGPLSDSFGRRGPVMLGLFVFLVGSALCYFSTDFTGVMIGRVLQGFGAAGPRVVAVAIVRDSYSGAAMARIMSVIMAVFIVVPAVAPALGQVVLWFGTWRDIFMLFVITSALALAWFALRQPETHLVEKRRRFSLLSIVAAMWECLRHPISLSYGLAAGAVFGAFVGFLTSIQQIFGTIFGAADQFTLYFAILALSIGAASITNSRLVMRIGMQTLCRRALLGLGCLSVLALGWQFISGEHPSLIIFMAIMMAVCFCFGILFGNFNSLAMEPMGHIAGSAAAVIASLTSFVAVLFGTSVGQAFDGTLNPLFGGFVIASLVGGALLAYAEQRRATLIPDPNL